MKIKHKEKLNYFEISEEEFQLYEIINKCIIDSVLSQKPQNNDEECQDIRTLKLPKKRHKTLAFFKKIFSGKYDWTPWEKVATNHKYKVNNGILNILVRKNITKDTNLIYITHADQIIELQKMGLTKSQALTSMTIEIAGRYKSIVADRIINSKIVTNKTPLKLNIVDNLQQLAALLQPIERCINTHSNQNYSTELRHAFDEYLKQLEEKKVFFESLNAILQSKNKKVVEVFLEQAKKEFNIDKSQVEGFLSYDHNYFKTQEKQIAEQIQNAKTFIKENAERGPEKINENLQGFLRQQLNDLVHNAQAQNDQITHNSDDSFLRGKLRDCLMEADKAICNYAFDQHNPITKEHQLDFRTQLEGGKATAVYHSRLHVGHSSKDLERALLGISILNSNKNVYDKGEDIKEVTSASWNNFSKHSKPQKLRRLGAWVLTNLVHLPLAVVNTFVAALTDKAPIARLMQAIEQKIQKWFKIQENFPHDFFRFKMKLGVNNVYTSTSLGKMLNKVFREVTGVILQSPEVIYKKATAQFELFKNDLKTGFWGYLYNKYKKNKKPVVAQEDTVEKLLNDLECTSRLQKLMINGQELNNLVQMSFKPIQFANPKNPLEPYHPHDILSSTLSGLESFVNFFKDDIFEKHPMMALIATFAYLFGGMAVLTPSALTIILTKMGLTSTQITHLVNSSVHIGKALAHGAESEAIAAGFTLAKMVGISVNTINQGFDSALFELLNELRKDPMIYTMGLAIAYCFGHMMTDVVHIPVITEYLKEEVGNVPALAKILIGAKLGVISLESALPEDEKHKSILAHFVGDIADMLLLTCRLVASIGTLSLEPWKNLKESATRGLGILTHSINRIFVLAGQLLTQIPKTLIETSSTVAVNILKLLNLFTRPFRTKKDHEVIGAGPLLRVKEKILHYGYKAAFFIRENTSRKAERAYGGYLTKLNHHGEIDTETTTAKLLAKLECCQKQEPKPVNKKPIEETVIKIQQGENQLVTDSKEKACQQTSESSLLSMS